MYLIRKGRLLICTAGVTGSMDYKNPNLNNASSFNIKNVP